MDARPGRVEPHVPSRHDWLHTGTLAITTPGRSQADETLTRTMYILKLTVGETRGTCRMWNVRR